MKLSSKFSDLAIALSTIAVFVFSANGCTKVDDSIGHNIVPNDQKMTVHIDTLSGVKTYLYRFDSIVSSNLEYAYAGKEYSSVYGERRNSFVIQFLPSSIPYKTGFGLDPIVDTLYLALAIDNTHGNTDVEQTFEVLRVYCDTLSVDSTYYSNFPISRFIKEDEVLFTFKHSGKENLVTALEPTALGREFMESLVKLDTAIYRNDSLFHKTYNGLYIRPVNESPRDAATYVWSLSSSKTYMVLNVRDHDSIDHTLIHDTLSAVYSILDGTKYGNLSINIVDFDYTGTPLGTLQAQTDDFTDTVTVQPECYVQMMGGVDTRLALDDVAQQLYKLRIIDGDTLSIMINQATMYIRIADQTVNGLNAAPTRLGSYLNIRNMTPIPDYMYAYEKSTQASDASYVLPYNGYLNRSNYYYPLNITSYIQHLMANETLPEDSDSRLSDVFYLSSSAYDFFGFGDVALKGYGSDQPIDIVVTYTLINNK